MGQTSAGLRWYQNLVLWESIHAHLRVNLTRDPALEALEHDWRGRRGVILTVFASSCPTSATRLVAILAHGATGGRGAI